MAKFDKTVNIRKPNVILQNQQGNIIKVNGIRKLCAMHRQLFIISFIVFCSAISAQDIFDIHFNFEHSLRLKNYFVNIKAERRGQDYTINLVTKDLVPNKNGNDNKYKITKDTTIKISQKTYQTLVDAVTKISCSDITTNIGNSGLDGTTCEIYYGDWASSISYKIWSPTYKTNERKLNDFLDACKLLLLTSGLKPSQVL